MTSDLRQQLWRQTLDTYRFRIIGLLIFAGVWTFLMWLGVSSKAATGFAFFTLALCYVAYLVRHGLKEMTRTRSEGTENKSTRDAAG